MVEEGLEKMELNPETEPIKEKENGSCEDQLSQELDWEKDDKMCWFKCKFGTGARAPELRFNPIVTFVSILLVAAFVVWCVLAQEHANTTFGMAKRWITMKFTWLYIGSQDVWAIVIIIIYFSKYGNMKLGKDTDEPEYNSVTWFTMLFACGVGVGMFFFGVSEPIYHYTGDNRYTKDVFSPQNEMAQKAINLTFYHWGLHGWIVYVVVGMVLAFVSYRKDMPMTMKSCFYPLIGNKIYTWIGDAIDILSVITTLFGVCTSLGLGVIQVNTGLNFIFEGVAINTPTQVLIIWIVTGIATISVVSGIGKGIRRLSEFCFGVGVFIMLAVFFLEDWWYLCNLFTQSIGYYFQWIIQLGTHSDAFAMAGTSYQGIETRGQKKYEDGETDGPENWMDSWTIFYWGWWISWSPFVGMFIAKISKGRTIREFINGSLTASILYTFAWMTIFGGTGIQTERIAAGKGLCCPNWSEEAINGTLAEEYRVAPQTWQSACPDVKTCAVCTGGDCNICSAHIIQLAREGAMAQAWVMNKETEELEQELSVYTSAVLSKDNFTSFLDHIKDTRGRFGKSSGDSAFARLSCYSTSEMWFVLMYTYGKLGTFLCIFSMLAIALYFVTSSDSGSLIIDIISANGDQDPPVLQRLFWALVEGATATSLLVVGGPNSLNALQTAAVITGLPYTVLLCFMCVAMWRGLATEFGDIDPNGAEFSMSLLEPITVFNPQHWLNFLKQIFITPYTLYKVNRRLAEEAGDTGDMTAGTLSALAAICWVTAIILLATDVEVSGLYSFAFVFYTGFIAIITSTRVSVRLHLNINGNPVEDLFASLLWYPSVAMQMEDTMCRLKLETSDRSDPKL